MCRKIPAALMAFVIVVITGFVAAPSGNAEKAGTEAFDKRVRQVLDSHRRGGMNIPEVDGKALYDLIIERGYRNVLEIGTSNGYSGIWIAWALSKTGGRLITIEIDRRRHLQAVEYFRKAGLSDYVDARLGNAHDLVPALPGPFDLVFCDADKDWYINYLKYTLPKITVGGCFAAHNVFESSGGRGRGGFWRGGGGRGELDEFLQYARSLPNLETRVLNLPGSGGLSFNDSS
ncbi:MAG TPA: class I SAM-dependent methyltransferase [Acidobacteriota bacterium]|nr:class I SAM-dependent methyltransferase [Acidobacteriota bacterium]